MANSSPSRPLNRRNHINVSSSEEEEPVEEQRSPRQVLSPDPSPPKLPPRSALAVSTPPAMSKKARMRKKDGSRPSEPESSRRASFPPLKSTVPSSNLSVPPAAIDWAVLEVGHDKHVIRAQNISLRRAGFNRDQVLELDGGGGNRACLPLENVSGLKVRQTRTSALTLVQPRLVSSAGYQPGRRRAQGIGVHLSAVYFPYVCEQFTIIDTAAEVTVDIALRPESGSQTLIGSTVEIIKEKCGLEADFVK